MNSSTTGGSGGFKVNPKRGHNINGIMCMNCKITDLLVLDAIDCKDCIALQRLEAFVRRHGKETVLDLLRKHDSLFAFNFYLDTIE